ncbi:MAG: hypothetical protein ISP66_01305 [Flavobacteriaceae bacterium]|nr:hypothetical protein [Flavobacteriaceae bacterium]
MKKGLLGLLVVALTVVGCQSYDDQFDELNSKIITLSTSISELDGIQTTVTTPAFHLTTITSGKATAVDLKKMLAEVSRTQ